MFKCSDEELISKFNDLKNRNNIASLLEIDEKSLRYILYVKRPENMYVNFKIPKKKNGFREISSPTESLKAIQRKLSYILNLVYKEKSCAYGFVKNKNIRMNAKQHAKRNYVFNIDLKDFFSSINFGRVRGMFLKEPYNLSKDIATIIAQLTCKDGILPQGSPTSPIITNMICRPLDTQLVSFAKKYSVTYTRYADDISFSCTRNIFPNTIAYLDSGRKACVGHALNKIICKNGFIINHDKVFLNHKTSRQEVTGLIVNKFPNLKRKYIKDLRAILHNCTKYGICTTAKKYIQYSTYTKPYIISLCNAANSDSEAKLYNWFKNVICGKIRFIGTIRGRSNPYFIKYATECNKIFKEALFDIGSIKLLQNSVFVIERDDGLKQGTGFFLEGLGLVTSYHVTPSTEYFYKFYNDFSKSSSILLREKLKYSNAQLDYAIYDISNPLKTSLKLGDSKNLNITDKIKIVGYASYQKGDTLYLEDGRITNVKNSYLGSKLYTVSSRLIHGSSGGPVINSNNEVIGIIKAGVESVEDEKDSIQGFLPIDLILKDIST